MTWTQGYANDSIFLQVSVGKFARNRIARSTSELRAECRNGYAFQCLSILPSVR